MIVTNTSGEFLQYYTGRDIDDDTFQELLDEANSLSAIASLTKFDVSRNPSPSPSSQEFADRLCEIATDALQNIALLLKDESKSDKQFEKLVLDNAEAPAGLMELVKIRINYGVVNDNKNSFTEIQRAKVKSTNESFMVINADGDYCVRNKIRMIDQAKLLKKHGKMMRFFKSSEPYRHYIDYADNIYCVFYKDKGESPVDDFHAYYNRLTFQFHEIKKQMK